jgi:hypothetical protein
MPANPMIPEDLGGGGWGYQVVNSLPKRLFSSIRPGHEFQIYFEAENRGPVPKFSVPEFSRHELLMQ